MCQCFRNISLECGVGEGRTMQCVGTLDIGQHTQVFVHTAQPPVVNMKEKDIKTLPKLCFGNIFGQTSHTRPP